MKLTLGHCRLSTAGPFRGIDSLAAEEEVEAMWRTLYKLGKAFIDTPGPRRVAETVRGKVERFRTFVPVMHCICNPGIRDRHWQQVRRGRVVRL